MAHQTTVIFLIICRDLIFFHISKNFFNNRVGYFCLNRTICIGHDGVGTARIKSGNKVPLFVITDRKLCLIAVMPRFFHSVYRLHLLLNIFFSKTADTHQAAFHKTLFKRKLFLIRNLL